ncbi:MAG: hypothetical protein LPK00_05645 [Bacillaceae bacterium]|nr:hypothetical protein [Bacillaceae bacterium]
MVKISRLNESLLEMVYFFPMKAEFEYILGKKVNAIYKPSPQKEAWLGFDQAWTNEEISEDEFYEILGNKGKTPRFLAYIMQFKVVEKQKHYKKKARTFTVPSHYNDGDLYYRSPLKTEPSNKGTTSQHELLLNIKSEFEFIEVYYACPMLFSQSDLFHPDFMKDENKFRKHLLELLVLVDVDTAPDPSTSSWKSSGNHHIMWQDKSGSDIYWCSEPKKGKKDTFKEWIEGLDQKIMSNEQLIVSLKELKGIKPDKEDEQQAFRDVYSKLTILDIGN